MRNNPCGGIHRCERADLSMHIDFGRDNTFAINSVYPLQRAFTAHRAARR